MKSKIFWIITLILINYALEKSYTDNENLYRKYDSSYSNNNFNIRSISSLKGRSDFLNGVDCSMVSIIEENGGNYIDFDGNQRDFFELSNFCI